MAVVLFPAQRYRTVMAVILSLAWLSSVQSPDRLGRGGGGGTWGTIQRRSSSRLFSRRPLWAVLEWDVHSLTLSIQHFLCRPWCRPPSKVPWKMILETVVECDVSEPSEFPSFDSWEKRLLRAHKEVDSAPLPVVEVICWSHRVVGHLLVIPSRWSPACFSLRDTVLLWLSFCFSLRGTVLLWLSFCFSLRVTVLLRLSFCFSFRGTVLLWLSFCFSHRSMPLWWLSFCFSLGGTALLWLSFCFSLRDMVLWWLVISANTWFPTSN